MAYRNTGEMLLLEVTAATKTAADYKLNYYWLLADQGVARLEGAY
jgi:hypothetical protein